MSDESFKVVLVDAKASASMEEKLEYNPLCVSADMKAPSDPEELMNAQDEAEMEQLTESNDIIFDTDDIDIDGGGIALFDMTWCDFRSRIEPTDDPVNIYKLNTDDCASMGFTRLCSENKYSFKLNTPIDAVSNLDGLTNMESQSNMYNIEFDNIFNADGGKACVNIDGDYKGNKSYATDAEDVELSIKGEGRDEDPYGSDDIVGVNWSENGKPKMFMVETSDMSITAIVLSLLSRNNTDDNTDDITDGLETLQNIDVSKHLDENNVVNFPFYLVSMNESMEFAPSMSFDNGTSVEVADKQGYQIVIRVGNENVEKVCPVTGETPCKCDEKVAEVEEHVAEVEEHVAEVEEHVADVKEPVADVKEHVADVEEPVADVKEPVADVKEPVADVKEPVADVKEPVADVKEPVE